VLAGYPPSVRVADSTLAGEPARYIAVVPDPNSPYPRARTGEVGLIEGWMLARAVHETIEADHNGVKRAVVAVIDVRSQQRMDGARKPSALVAHAVIDFLALAPPHAIERSLVTEQTLAPRP
jgi:biotin-independent malonate decarboxylase gamma subunit